MKKSRLIASKCAQHVRQLKRAEAMNAKERKRLENYDVVDHKQGLIENYFKLEEVKNMSPVDIGISVWCYEQLETEEERKIQEMQARTGANPTSLYEYEKAMDLWFGNHGAWVPSEEEGKAKVW